MHLQTHPMLSRPWPARASRGLLLAGVLLGAWAPASQAGTVPINVGNFVWEDRNRNGVQDAGEPGMPGITVQLWNGTKTQLHASTTTNASGSYTVQAPGPGDYRVRVLLPSGQGAEFSPKDQGGNDLLDSDIHPSGGDFGFTHVYTFPSNLISITTIDAGIVLPRPINVGNFVWEDRDGDGVQDAGEPGMPGITVQLWNGARNDLIDSTTTNASGIYTLVAPGPGDYRVRVLLPSGQGAQFSPRDQGGNDVLDSDVHPSGGEFGFTGIYSFASNLISITSIDAGLLLPSAIGDRVWNDTDADGMQDAGERGVAGVTVQLWNDARNQILDSTATDTDGHYALIAPAPGSYRVRVLLPGNGVSFSPKDQGGDDALDSDIHSSGSLFGFTDTLVIGVTPEPDTRVDAGMTGFDVFADGFE